MPVHDGYDQKGKYYQYGESGKKYHVADYGEEGARQRAYAQQSAIEHSGYTEKMEGSFLPVGEDSEYDADQLAKGNKVEMEHTTDPKIAKMIAKHHLDEFEGYYDALEKMEERLTKEGKKRDRKRKRSQNRNNYAEKSETVQANRVQVGFHPQYGKYYRWGEFGIPYYVNVYGDSGARQRAYNDGALERLRGGY